MSNYKETLKNIFKSAHASAKKVFGKFFGFGRSYKQLFKEYLKSAYRSFSYNKQAETVTVENMNQFEKPLKYNF